LSYVLFFVYLLLFCWLISRLPFFKESGIDTRLLVGLFLLRIVAGALYGYINTHYYTSTDTAAFQRKGIAEYYLLFNDTREYFANFFRSNHNNSYSGVLESSGSYWNDTRSNVIIKMLSLFNILSFKNFYINTLFFNFCVFFGPVALYKVFSKIFPGYSLALVACIFLLPSTIYFSSGIHRDGLIFLSVSMVIYHLSGMMETGKFSVKAGTILFIFLLLIFLLRNFVLITMVPALLSWIIAKKKPGYAFVIFAGIYFFLGVLFFCSGYISPKFDLPAHVSERQISFIIIARGGGSAININPLFPNFRSFLNNTPQALNHSLMRPYVTEHLNWLYVPAAWEVILYEILFILLIFFRKKNITISPLIYFSLFFGISMFLVIGYTIPIIGAIVRYRSIYFPLLLIPVICYTDWSFMKRRII
jgi:hypothetical protein